MKKFVNDAGRFFRTLRGCISRTWQEADSHYHIPKSRFGDAEYNQTAYSSTQVQDVHGKVGTFFRTLKSCISMAWKESDHYYHLPKSRYQDPVFVREKMTAAPRPQGKFFKGSFTVGLGISGERTEDGWSISRPGEPSGFRPDEEFIVPDDGADFSRKPEIGPE